VIHEIHGAEASDTDGVRWPRTKRHHDKVLTALHLAPRPAQLVVTTTHSTGGCAGTAYETWDDLGLHLGG
jgi:hypothetical protein